MERTYSALCWLVGALFLVIGAFMLVGFVRSLAPGSSGGLTVPIGPNGYYFVAFTGSCLVAWGGCLLGAARGQGGRSIGTATAVGLVLMALYRMMVWFTGDFAWVGHLPRYEASLFLLLALAFVWLRPATAAAAAR